MNKNKHLKEYGGESDYKKVIQNCIKFMRTINTGIVEECTENNLEDRTTYRGVNAAIFK